jgi:hypothetical protein
MSRQVYGMNGVSEKRENETTPLLPLPFTLECVVIESMKSSNVLRRARWAFRYYGTDVHQ